MLLPRHRLCFSSFHGKEVRMCPAASAKVFASLSLSDKKGGGYYRERISHRDIREAVGIGKEKGSE